ncbi:MAG: insulinase family protein, partial [Candidatus Eremiobacteraeota bacterium]|nr:insulinase family protein [Candidatus Eremiobacteraeota bacterium]
MKHRSLTAALAGVVLAALVALAAPAPAAAANLTVTRATLANGLQIVVVHDPLAPVVTTMLNYKVGSDEQPIDGLAHATEHMMFRGSSSLSSGQLMDAVGVTGGNFNADTQSGLTQYFFTVPSQYLDIALRLERSRATGLLMSQNLWLQESGAITQEVTQDNSNALYRIFQKLNNRMLAGTPYAKNGLGTIYGFAHQVNSKELLKFYKAWYHPNNALYVIVGDVDGPTVVNQVRSIFGDIPAAKLPARSPVVLRPFTGAVYRDTSDQPFTAVLLGYRLPGYDSPDYAAGVIAGDVLNSQRGALAALTAAGKVYQAGFQAQSFSKTTVGLTYAIVPISTKPETADGWLRSVITTYAKWGVPADLVAAAKLREVSDLEFAGNSIEGLASQWSSALAVQGLHSPDDMIVAFDKVSASDVNRVLRSSFDNTKVIAAYAVPKNIGKLSISGGMHAEDNSIPPSTHQVLVPWAQRVLEGLQVPKQTLAPVSMMLPNGLRLIVQSENITHTVVVSGSITSNAQVQEPAGKDGVADLTAALMPFGTTHYDRIGLQREFDKIAASANVGTQFGISTLTANFDRGVALLADEELHPAFDATAFGIVRGQEAKSVADAADSPDHLTEVALANALYPLGDPQRRFATAASVGSVGLDDVKAWFAGAYRPDMTTIVVIGDTTPAKARAVIEKYFGGWSATGSKPNVYPAPVAANAPGAVSVPATGRVQSSVQMVETIGLLRNDPDWANLQVANTALTGGFYSSLLYHDLREVHGYVYNVSSAVAAGKVRST